MVQCIFICLINLSALFFRYFILALDCCELQTFSWLTRYCVDTLINESVMPQHILWNCIFRTLTFPGRPSGAVSTHHCRINQSKTGCDNIRLQLQLHAYNLLHRQYNYRVFILCMFSTILVVLPTCSLLQSTSAKVTELQQITRRACQRQGQWVRHSKWRTSFSHGCLHKKHTFARKYKPPTLPLRQACGLTTAEQRL